MKALNGKEIAEFIEQRQAKQVRALRARNIVPKLVIVQCKVDPIIDTYIKLKKRYGAEIGVEVESSKLKQSDVATYLQQANQDGSVHGIIVQLPLEIPDQTEEIVNLVAPTKDVDALGLKSTFDAATPMAIQWLLAGYNVDLRSKKIVIVGQGKLVGAPLAKQLLSQGLQVSAADIHTKNLADLTANADILISATGSPGLITPSMVKQGAVVVDAGVASESGKTVGDAAPELYERDDLVISPHKGGVGPLTVCALFENVIRACEAQ